MESPTSYAIYFPFSQINFNFTGYEWAILFEYEIWFENSINTNNINLQQLEQIDVLMFIAWTLFFS